MRRTKDIKLHLCRFVGENKKEQKIHIMKKGMSEVIPGRLRKISLCGLERTKRDYLLRKDGFDKNILYTDLCLNCVSKLLKMPIWKLQLNRNYPLEIYDTIDKIVDNVREAKKIVKDIQNEYTNTIEKHKKETETLIKEYNKHSIRLRRRLDLSMYRLTEKALNHNSESVRRVMIQNIHNSFMFFDNTHIYETLDLTMRILRKG